MLALAVPASAAVTVAVTPAPGSCGVVVAISGLGEGVHAASVQATVPGSGAPVPVVEQPPGTPPPTAPPVLTAVRTVTGDGEAVVVLDAAAVPDADPRVVVAVTVDGVAAPTVELALPGCGAPATGAPTATPAAAPTSQPTGQPTGQPTAAPATQPATPSTEQTPPSPASPSSAAPAAPAPSESPRATTSPTPTTVTPLVPVPASPVLSATAVPGATPEQADGAFDLDGDLSDGSSLTSFTAAPRLGSAPAPEPVPAPVIAAPEGSAAGVLADATGTRTPLDGLLPPAPEVREGGPVPAQLAAPVLATDAAADPLVDLAPAAFVLSASLGGLLMAGRRRPS